MNSGLFAAVGVELPLLLIASAILLLVGCQPVRQVAKGNKNPLTEILQNHARELGGPILSPNQFRTEIIYTQIDRNERNEPVFTDYTFSSGAKYHYPASTVKLPTAVVALEKINSLEQYGIKRSTPLQTLSVRASEADILNDSTAPNRLPSVENYIKKILLVSDNEAYNRLYEFVGQQALNHRLHELGFTDAQLIHRLGVFLSEAEHRTTNPIQFVDGKGQIIFAIPKQESKLEYAKRNDSVGSGYFTNDSIGKTNRLVMEPMDFSKKNRWCLKDHHQLIKWIMFPEFQPAENRLALTANDYGFLQKYMAMTPEKSQWPSYQANEYWPSYVKFLFYGAEKTATLNPHIKIFNKVGDAYGFLLDGMYLVDFEHKLEFLLSAVVYCNRDEILNDDQYDYDEIGLPFMKQLGKLIYNYERNRIRKHPPVFSNLAAILQNGGE